jgi:hypothetical protein
MIVDKAFIDKRAIASIALLGEMFLEVMGRGYWHN